ncbi:Phage protein [Yersinia phage fHe-Yen9-03]|uniref:Phage protein n=1 Tax=Yersinia phage fHe-Yen9-03 TaxID=2052743 RepID=A0A2C9CZV5_9CAUD|nr:Phage protein [Yersinia phage fHe-Yen9-03]
MKISTNSWHYKMNEYVYDMLNKNISNSLCGYFWQTVFAPIITLTIVLLGLVVISILSWGAFYLVGALFSNFLVWINVLPESFQLLKKVFNWRFIPMSILFDVLVVGVFYSKHKYSSYKERKIEEAKEKGIQIDSKPLLVVEYIKAKKRKICPLIEFTKD